MKAKATSMLLVLICVLFLGSCNENRGIIVSEGVRSDARMDQIISALKDRDSAALKSLFSEKALDETNDIDSEIIRLFDFFQGEIESWEKDGWASSESVRYGKKSLMIRFEFDIKTDIDAYTFFVMDYNTDTINRSNEGVFMLEVSKSSYSGEWKGWQERMRAGIAIYQNN